MSAGANDPVLPFVTTCGGCGLKCELRLLKHVAGLGNKHTPSGSELHVARFSHKQRIAGMNFELTDLFARGRRRKTQANGGPAEVKFLGHGGNVTKVPQFNEV